MNVPQTVSVKEMENILDTIAKETKEPDEAMTKELSVLLNQQVSRWDFEKMKSLLNRGADPNSTDSRGRTALSCVINSPEDMSGTPFLKLFLEYGADPNSTPRNARDRFSEAPLYCAMMQGDADLVSLLLEHGANPNITSKSGTTLLHVIQQSINHRSKFAGRVSRSLDKTTSFHECLVKILSPDNRVQFDWDKLINQKGHLSGRTQGTIFEALCTCVSEVAGDYWPQQVMKESIGCLKYLFSNAQMRYQTKIEIFNGDTGKTPFGLIEAIHANQKYYGDLYMDRVEFVLQHVYLRDASFEANINQMFTFSADTRNSKLRGTLASVLSHFGCVKGLKILSQAKNVDYSVCESYDQLPLFRAMLQQHVGCLEYLVNETECDVNFTFAPQAQEYLMPQWTVAHVQNDQRNALNRVPKSGKWNVIHYLLLRIGTADGLVPHVNRKRGYDKLADKLESLALVLFESKRLNLNTKLEELAVLSQFSIKLSTFQKILCSMLKSYEITTWHALIKSNIMSSLQTWIQDSKTISSIIKINEWKTEALKISQFFTKLKQHAWDTQNFRLLYSMLVNDEKFGLKVEDESLLIACQHNNTSEAIKLINTTFNNQNTSTLANVNYPDVFGRTPMWYAAKHNNVKILSTLVKLNQGEINVDLKDGDSKSPFYLACELLHYETVKWLVDKTSIDLNSVDKNGCTPLMVLITNGANQRIDQKILIKTIQSLVENPKCDVNFSDINKTTALMKAIDLKLTQVITFIVKNSTSNLNIQLQNESGITALDMIIERGDLNLFQKVVVLLMNRLRIKNTSQLVQSLIDQATCEKWIEIAKSSNNDGCVSFVSALMDAVANNTSIDVIKAMLDNDQNSEQFEEALVNNLKDRQVANYLFKHLDQSSLNNFFDIINNGLTKQECGFSDELLFLAEMINPKKLSQTLESCTDACLSESKKNIEKYTFFKNNLLHSNIWCHKINEKKESDDESDENDLLFHQIKSKIIDKELTNQKTYIKQQIMEVEQNYAKAWSELKSIKTWSDSSSSTQMDCVNAILPEYEKRHLPIDNVNGFDGSFEYDMNAYLTRVLIAAYRIDPIFQKSCKALFSTDNVLKNGVYAPAPVKTKSRSQDKARLDYSDRKWPYTSNIVDFVRCSIVYKNCQDLCRACAQFENIVNSKNKDSGCIVKIVRRKNGFAGFPDNVTQNSNNIDLKVFDYADIKYNVVLRYNDIELIGEIQFLVNFMLESKKKGHSIYSFVRKEDFFQQLYLLAEMNDEDAFEQRIKKIILSKNLSKWSALLQACNEQQKLYIVKNMSWITTFMKENSWKKSAHLLELTVSKWKSY